MDLQAFIGLAFVLACIYGVYTLFRTKPKSKQTLTLKNYPDKGATHYGKTFNEWRTMKGYKLEKYSVPEDDLPTYCADCGWPTKGDWQTVFDLPSGFLDSYQYSLWVKFIGVVDDDRHPDDAINVANYIYSLRK